MPSYRYCRLIREAVAGEHLKRLHSAAFALASPAFASGDAAMRKTIPATMFAARDQSRLVLLQDWVLHNAVTEIEMNERQFWNFVSVQPVAEKPWTTYMGRLLHVSDMPTESQKCLGLFDKRTAGTI
jgi:hypothetical protein